MGTPGQFGRPEVGANGTQTPAATNRRPSLLKKPSSSGLVAVVANHGSGTSQNQTNGGTSGTNSASGHINNTNHATSGKRVLSGGSNDGGNLTSHLTLSNSATPSNSAHNHTHLPQINRTRSRSLSKNQHGTAHAPQYWAQEKVYLKKLRNQTIDDYYTKGISGAETEGEEESTVNDLEEEEDTQQESKDILAEIDEDKYQIDLSLAFSMVKDGIVNPNKDISQLSLDSSDDPAVLERLEWQSMLTSVLTGDVVTSEKTKIIESNSLGRNHELSQLVTYKDNLWYGIKAKLLGRTEDDERKLIAYRRTLVDTLIDDILTYEIVELDPTVGSPRTQVIRILERYEKCCELWKTLEDMRQDKPLCRSHDFVDRIDALNAWLSITDAIERESNSLRMWIGNDELDITKSPVNTPSSESPATTPTKVVKKIFDEDNKSLAERLMKEKDVHTIFKQRIFIPLAPWMIKAKDTYIYLKQIFESIKLPDYIHSLIQLCLVPMKLIKEIINVRLKYAMKLQNPTLMMIDQMLDDFKSYITIALEVKLGFMQYFRPDASRTWMLQELFESEYLEFDKAVLSCVDYFLVLLSKKLLDGSRSSTNFRTFKEPEELEEAWNFLRWLGDYVDGGSPVVSVLFTHLTLKLIHRLLAYFNHQIRSPPPNLKSNSTELIRWYSSTSEHFGQLRRKLSRFAGEISRTFTNSIVYELHGNQGQLTKELLDELRNSEHFLVYTGTVESQGTYFFASPELMGRETEIYRMIHGSYIGLSVNDSNQFDTFLDILNMDEKPSEVDDLDNNVALPLTSQSNDLAYVLAICPAKPIVWEGEVVRINTDEVPINDLKVGQVLLVTTMPFYSLDIIKEKFTSIFDSSKKIASAIKQLEVRCSLAKVHYDLSKIDRLFFKMTLAVLDSVRIVRSKCLTMAPESDFQELINNYFIYARDYGRSSIKNLDTSRKSTVIMKLIQLSIEWVSFISDDCIPTDRKTFRWCVLALEFAMDMTRGFNVLVLDEEQFYKLKMKVARCMSLLISHFDIMGARSSEAEKKKLLKWTALRHRIENSADDELILQAYRDDVMGQIETIEEYRRELQDGLLTVGRVLEVTDLEYQFVTLLASSFSSVSIRWQKGRFIGGGTFGSVFSAVNLDTGGVMAVKEIRFHDSQSIKNIVPSIKDEMTVLEMLNHPNIVQYFGVEVHRDKVYIFMEFCEGGSLASLLTHGRIEDEMVVQVYTLQMLEGLAYLHHSGVVHRDLKPENILLDHNGVIKFVDFGAAKVIATSGRTRTSGSTSRRGSAGGDNSDRLNSMTGTPMYMSPEAITGSSSSKSGVVDIWSLGCCVLEMATGRRPWANLDNEWAIMYHIAAGHQPQLPSSDQLSAEGCRFLSRCLEHDPTKRPSAMELLADPWIVQIRLAAFDSSEASSTPSSEQAPEVN